MATKAKTTKTASVNTEIPDMSEFFNTDFFNQASFQEGFSKVMNSYGEIANFNKDMLEALVKSATLAGKGAEALQTEVAAFSKQSLDESAAVAKEAFTAKSVQDLVEIQTNFSKTFLDAYMGNATKVAEMISETTAEVSQPLNEQFTAAVNAAQGGKS